MGLIFDRNIASFYDSWYRSPQGRAIDRSIERIVVALLDPRPGERALDIGCGSGNHLIIFTKMGLHVSGIDASPHMVDRARKRLGHGCTLKEGRAEELPFDDNEFDLAFLINTLEFLDDPVQALREAGRVANKKVFVGVINSFSWSGLLKKAGGYLGDPLFRGARFYSLWHLKSLLQVAYGNVPISWGCVRIRPALIEQVSIFGKDLWTRDHSPFGYFLCASATMLYTKRANTLPLKVRVKKTRGSLVGAGTLSSKGANGYERSLPV